MNISNIAKFVAVSVLVVSTAMVFAQGGGGGGGRGGGQGRGGFGGQFGGRGGFGGGVHQLANRADVQRDINATEDQKTKIAALNETMREEMRSIFGGFGGGGERPDPETMRANIEKYNEKGKTELAKILDANQMKRIDEIQIQLAGPSALLLPAVQKALGLSKEQTDKLTTLQRQQMEANQTIQEKVRNQEISREEAQAARERNNTALQTEFNKVLTAEQQTKFKEMQGKPFKADPPQGRGGGGL